MGIFSSVQIALGHPSVDDKSLQMKELQITGNKLWIIDGIKLKLEKEVSGYQADFMEKAWS